MSTDKVEVVPHPTKRGKYALKEQGNEEGFFYNNRKEVRSFTVPSDAVYFLKKVCEQYPHAGYIVTMPKGEVKTVGAAQFSEDEYGPHEWEKKNLVTIISGGSNYDIYRCKFCGREEKAYGLNGHSRKTGVCGKNPLKVEQ